MRVREFKWGGEGDGGGGQKGRERQKIPSPRWGSIS